MIHAIDPATADLRQPEQPALGWFAIAITPLECGQLHVVKGPLASEAVSELWVGAVIGSEDDVQYISWSRHVVNDGIDALTLFGARAWAELQRTAAFDLETPGAVITG